MSFLDDVELRQFSITGIPGSESLGLALGEGPQPALEIAVIQSANQPAVTAIRGAWKERHGGRAAPVLLVCIYGDRAAICGPVGDDPPVLVNVELGQAERLCLTALQEPDRHSALRFLRPALEAIDSPMAGVRNEGLLSTHEIGVWLKERRDIAEAKAKSATALTKTGQQLVMSLGFEVSPLPGSAYVLVSQSQRLALALFLDRGESPDTASQRFPSSSPVTYALTKADQENLPYVVIANGPALRIYPTNPGVGVGRRGRTETFLELHLDLLKDDHTPLLWYLFSADALDADGTFEKLLSDSKDYATSLGERLRERVYQDAIPQLAKALVAAQSLKPPTQQDLDSTYHMALTLLFRILFIAYGEDKDLLPYRTNDLYRARSFKQKAREMVRIREEGTEFDTNSFDHWDDAVRLFEAVNGGSQELGVPEYNGGLFSKDPQVSRTGAALSDLRLSNSAFGPVVSHILVDDSPEGIGPVDFRSLGVREFGTIYEGLLESELSIAETDLIVDREGVYKPADGTEPQVRSGDVYIHNKSGARKASGSYFTKAFAVDHLLDHSLEPALDEHTTWLGKLDEVEAGKAFFDFRVADIAMGSGHFLVAAVDRIERRLQQYLAERPLPAVKDELVRLRNSAIVALGPLADGTDIEDTTLLRRQIARRCIYGVDLNLIAVELARVSLWIHTFVPGLPLSMLDHHLVEGNSLVGIGTLDEAKELVSGAAGGPLFNVFVENIIRTASQSMTKVGDLADADAAEIQTARGALASARLGIDPLKAMFDILAASRLGADIAKEVSNNVFGWPDNPEEIRGSNLYRTANEVMAGIEPFHFPVVFPDVFARARAGFDVILGNPPWEKARVEEHGFWARHFPGFKGISQREREARIPVLRDERKDLARLLETEVQDNLLLRKTLTTGPFPGMGTGDPDLYKAFCWRFWHMICNDGGHLGVVLPRAVWSLAGSEDFRRVVLHEGQALDLTFLVNNRRWIFENVHPQYTIALTSLIRGTPKDTPMVTTSGPYPSLISFNEGVQLSPARFEASEILTWTGDACVPLLTANGANVSGEIFRQIRKQPNLVEETRKTWSFAPYRELDATNDKHLITFSQQAPKDYWPVYKGGSFDLWTNDLGANSYYGWADPDKLVQHLYSKRNRSFRMQRSVFRGLPREVVDDADSLSIWKPRIVFRDVTRATDSRSVRVALIPPRTPIVNPGNVCMRISGDEKGEAFLLGVLSSLPLDWWARRIIEIHLNIYIFRDLPIPQMDGDNSLHQRTALLAARLAATDERYEEWSSRIGVPYGPLENNEKEDMIHELDAAVAHLYGLSESQLRHIFETFHVGWDYGDRLASTLDHYHRLESKL